MTSSHHHRCRSSGCSCQRDTFSNDWIDELDSEDEFFTIGSTGSTCPPSWLATVKADHSRGLLMLDRAIHALGTYNGTTPTRVRSALSRHFKNTSVSTARWIRVNLQYLRSISTIATYQCRDSGDEFCGSNTAAFVYWCVPLMDIRICSPRYFRQGNRQRSRTLIHEWVHKYGCNFDLGYHGSTSYTSAGTLRALINADSWAHLVYDIS